MNDLIFSGLARTAAPVPSSAQISRSIYVTRPSRRTSITCAKRVPYISWGALLILSGGARIVFLNSSRSRGGGFGERALLKKKGGGGQVNNSQVHNSLLGNLHASDTPSPEAGNERKRERERKG